MINENAWALELKGRLARGGAVDFARFDGEGKLEGKSRFYVKSCESRRIVKDWRKTSIAFELID